MCTGCDFLDPGKARLIVIRGNSASGKSTIAAAIRGKYGRGLAVVSQDNIRRVVLREHDRPGGANIGLLGLTCRYAIGAGFCTVLEGILCSAHYGQMLAGLRAEYGDRSSWWYVDVPFEQTLQRHATKPQVSVYGRAEMSAWWHEHDLLPRGGSSRSSRPPRQPRPPLTRSCAMPG